VSSVVESASVIGEAATTVAQDMFVGTPTF
jgi:hypothetical protein